MAGVIDDLQEAVKATEKGLSDIAHSSVDLVQSDVKAAIKIAAGLGRAALDAAEALAAKLTG